jgi:hypothetical protein
MGIEPVARRTRRHVLLTLGAVVGGAAAIDLDGARADVVDTDGLNVFISPCGQPFRAPKGAPYPISSWFRQADANSDGKLDHAEFVADAAAFFKILDRNGDGIIGAQELAYYERRICPEILGLSYALGAAGPGRFGPAAPESGRLWLAQFRPDGLDEVPSRNVDTNIEPLGKPRTDALDLAKLGAAPFSLFDEPEPVATADLDLNGKITRANFLRLADMHFSTLDQTGIGYLTLKQFPKTAAQLRVEHPHYR